MARAGASLDEDWAPSCHPSSGAPSNSLGRVSLGRAVTLGQVVVNLSWSAAGDQGTGGLCDRLYVGGRDP